jgi:leucyl-tRNA synthetase
MEYGTGAIMSVPAHDQRDFEFARAYGIPVKVVITPGPDRDKADGELTAAFEDEGILVDSGPFTGMGSAEAKGRIIDFIEERGLGRRTVNYKLRDWGISRQRYWGTPIPVVYCSSCGIVPVPEKDLPVILPEDVSITGKGASPLHDSETFLRVPCPSCNGEARRETDTMDTFVDSSWYFVAYCVAKGTINLTGEDEEGGGESEIHRWMPVDQYIGGIEHAVLHLLYSRFFTKVMRDLGIVRVDEPFLNLLTQGMVCKETLRCPDHDWLLPREVKDSRCIHCGREVERGRVEKMSKSKKNVVDPDVLMDRYGADTIRLFSLFAAPPERDLEWSDQGVEGAYRFLNKFWSLVQRHRAGQAASPSAGRIDREALGDEGLALLRKTHQTVRKVTEDIDRDYHFNTAIAALMELTNQAIAFAPRSEADRVILGEAVEKGLLLLSPFAPHLAEELWEALGRESSTFETPWPRWDEDLARDEEAELVIQVNGKLRSKLLVPAGLPDEEAKVRALADPKISEILAGRRPKRVVAVQGRLVNIVL